MLKPRKETPKEGDWDVVARTIKGEAANQDILGKMAIADVIFNRFWSNKWFSAPTLRGVCKKKRQFSCWNPGDPALRLVNGPKDATYWQCYNIACDWYRLRLKGATSVTEGSTHYHTRAVKPKWSVGVMPVALIGDHLFYKNIP